MHEADTLTLLSGRAFTAAEIAQVRETVVECAALPWSEVVQTMGEHLEWVTPTGRNKCASCAKALATLERAGLLALPAEQDCALKAFTRLAARLTTPFPRPHAADASASRTRPEIAPIIMSHHRAPANTRVSFPLEVRRLRSRHRLPGYASALWSRGLGCWGRELAL